MCRIKMLMTFLAFCFISNGAYADVEVGISVDKDGLKGFYLAVGDHYQIAEKEIIIAHKRSIPNEDLPVVFFIAQHAGVKYNLIIDMRLKGKSWMDIAMHFHLPTNLFYVPLHNPGPPYGKALGHFKKKQRSEWSTISLSDAEITAIVSLKFISLHYGYSVDDVANMHSKGQSFISINANIKEKKSKSVKQLAKQDKSPQKSKGKGKKKKK